MASNLEDVKVFFQLSRKTDPNPTDISAISLKPALPDPDTKSTCKNTATGTVFIPVIPIFNIHTSEEGCIFVNDQIKPNSWQLTVYWGSSRLPNIWTSATLQNAWPGSPLPRRNRSAIFICRTLCLHGVFFLTFPLSFIISKSAWPSGKNIRGGKRSMGFRLLLSSQAVWPLTKSFNSRACWQATVQSKTLYLGFKHVVQSEPPLIIEVKVRVFTHTGALAFFPFPQETELVGAQ